jgi:hypothetical protein
MTEANPVQPLKFMTQIIRLNHIVKGKQKKKKQLKILNQPK